LLRAGFVSRVEIKCLNVKIVAKFAIGAATATAVAATPTATATAGALTGRGVVAAFFTVCVGVVLLGVDLVGVVRLSVNGFDGARGGPATATAWARGRSNLRFTGLVVDDRNDVCVGSDEQRGDESGG